ncbi:MAG: LysM peptidoglycan-binding domain-containing protein [Eubacteriales bacterium]|nr:LysM peptidoglycan-binding domain-containing protein [Eubacteriales bacterium]
MKAKKKTRILLAMIIGILMLSSSFLSVRAADSSAGSETAEAVQTAETASESASAAASGEQTAASGFRYEHDPMENPKAAKDIVVNPDAVYGYSPNPDSTRLGQFASADWTDPAMVAQYRDEREQYHASMSGLYRMIEDMLGEGKNVEEIARAVSKRRNEIRLEAYGDDTESLEKAKKSNLETYGHEEGPTADSLYEKYGSWQTVLEKALSSNPGMDACLGMYDEYYDTYDLADLAAANAAPETTAGSGAEGTADAEAGTEETADTEAGTEETAGETPAEETAAGTGTEGSSETRTYKVISGDSLWKIAEEQYGDGSKWNIIYEENKADIPNPRLIFPGQELVIPGAA